MNLRLKYLFLTVCCPLLFLAQNTKAIRKCIRELNLASTADTAKIRLSLTLASEFAGFKKDSALYYNHIAKELLHKYPNDQDLADAEYLEALVYYSASEFESAQKPLNECVLLSKKLNNKLLLSKAYNLSGAIYYDLGNYEEATHQYDNKLFIAAELRDTVSLIETFYNFSLINNAEGAYYKSLENNYTALRLAEKIRDSSSIMVAYGGLGLSYYKIKDYKKAILYLKKALQLAMIHKRSYEQSGNMVDLGNVYREINQSDKALYYYNRARNMSKANGDRLIESIAISEKGSLLAAQGDYAGASALFREAIQIDQEINYAKGLAENYRKMAECFIVLKDFREAKSYGLKSLELLNKTVDRKEEALACKAVSEAYESFHNSDSAYFYYLKYVAVSDSSGNKTMLRKISDYESRYQKDRIEQERAFEEKKHRAELQKQKQTRNITLGAAGLILLMLLLAYRNYKQKEKANVEIIRQKKIIEDKNKDIVDSINYSKRLQDAFLASQEELNKLLPQSFVLYEPREIVSHNFYFIETKSSGAIHIALADCPGQGVSGAFMSILGYSILKQALRKDDINTPGKTLAFLYNELNVFLKNQSQGPAKNLEIGYCEINPAERRASFSGVGRSLWISTSRQKTGLSSHLIHKEGEKFLYEIKSESALPARSVSELKLEEGDKLFLFTDGILLQKNSAGEAFGKGRVLALISEISNLPPVQQQQTIKTTLSAWMGNTPRTDDICIIGFGF